MKKVKLLCFLTLLIFFTSCKERSQMVSSDHLGKESIAIPSTIQKIESPSINGIPTTIVRSIIQDKAGNIWFATFDGVFMYDGKEFINVLKDISQARFFSVFEDSKANLWFGSIGSGVYRYDGKSFKNFTTDDGLLNNEVVSIYEDTQGWIWFGVNGGASKYDGVSFKNYLVTNEGMTEDLSLGIVPNMQRPMNEVNCIIEDKKGKLWFATRGSTFIFNGYSFTKIETEENHFGNVRWLTMDKRGDIWLGGMSGLWKYDGEVFHQITSDFIGYVHQDKAGNIWTSSETNTGWTLSRYDYSSLENESLVGEKIKTNEGMFFGILEDADQNIWAGTLKGVYRYQGKSK